MSETPISPATPETPAQFVYQPVPQTLKVPFNEAHPKIVNISILVSSILICLIAFAEFGLGIFVLLGGHEAKTAGELRVTAFWAGVLGLLSPAGWMAVQALHKHLKNAFSGSN